MNTKTKPEAHVTHDNHWRFSGGCLNCELCPQAWKITRSRKTKDISTGMYLLTVVGFALWIGFGIGLGQWPLIAANSICLLLSGFILLMKLLPASKKVAVARTVDPTS
jgi:MtN3 and saliva related transmembrane protein